ncbi:MAG TPA: SH3 domain-containing protein [Terriglobales bacterium]|nr:SH3 domain-containing protein [Terriglobales bacterium]
MAQSTIQTRLCPHCANTIGADALKCPYCKAELSPVPQWPEREDEPQRPVQRVPKQPLTVKSKAILALGLLLFALGVYLVGGQQQRSDLGPMLALKQQQLDERDQKIKSLEDQLAQLHQQSLGNASSREQLTAKLKTTENELATVRKRLAAANREVERLSSTRVAVALASRATNPLPPAPTSSPGRRANSGLYETVRPTTVFDGPETSARILSRISKGTQVSVVRSSGDWLEIRSKHGNPSGFIRADDAVLVTRSD